MTEGNMAGDRLPIVFKSGLRIGLICFGCAAVSAVASYAELSEQYPRSVTFLHLVKIDGRTAGWLFAAFAVLLAGLALVALLRGCPRLVLDADGIAFSRCFGSAVQIPWSRYAGAEVKRMVAPGPRRSAVIDVVYVVTADGNRTSLGNFGSSQDVADTIRRVAARVKSGKKR